MEKFAWVNAPLCICVVGILFFGLKPKDYSFENQVKWIDGGPGIRFGRYGSAHSVVSLPLSQTDRTQPFTVEMVVQPARSVDIRFQTILLLHGGEDASQLVIGQWRSSIVVMNGDKYDGSAGHRTIYASEALSMHKPHMVTITSGQRGSGIYIDGKQMKQKGNLRLRLPSHNDGVSLVLGNGIYGERGWVGDVTGLALYLKELSGALIRLHHAHWLGNGVPEMDRQAAPYLHYDFSARGGLNVLDHGPRANHLVIPTHRKCLKSNMLLIPWYDIAPRKSDIMDVAVNVLGFIPMGFFLMVRLSHCHREVTKTTVFIAVMLTLSLSLMVELTQGFMPSRSSTVSDLFANTMGGFFGAKAWVMKFKKKKTPARPEADFKN